MLTTIHLHGRLGQKFGELFRLDVSSVAEAVRALCRLRKGFQEYVIASEKHGMAYQVRVGDRLLSSEELVASYDPKVAEIHLLPVPYVHGKNVLQIIVGIVLIIVSVYVGPGAAGSYWSTIGSASIRGAAALLGTSLVVQGVAGLIIGTPKFNTSGLNSEETNRSYLFNGSQQTTRQGVAVPLGYGRLHIGPQVVSLGISTQEEIGSYGYDSTPISTVTGSVAYGGMDSLAGAGAGASNPVVGGGEMLMYPNGGEDFLGGISIEGKPYFAQYIDSSYFSWPIGLAP